MTRVTFAVDHVTDGGRTYKQGTTHEINAADARELIYNAKGVDAGPEPEPANDKPADKKKEG
jgi:hypothetical protein